MQFRSTAIEGLHIIDPFVHQDERGLFVKPFRTDHLEAQGLESNFRECFYSESARGVIRGMHFQAPPHDHAKLVFCTMGTVLDVVLDIRKNSPTFGHCEAFSLSEDNHRQLYIPRGLAHGFCALSNKARVFYFTTLEHYPESDSGIRYNSFGFEWPIVNPIVSPRDAAFASLSEFESPF